MRWGTKVVVLSECRELLFYYPISFTPNGDNLNDLLFVEGTPSMNCIFAIYNRWGERVFETDWPVHWLGWDPHGNELSPDAFAYLERVV